MIDQALIDNHCVSMRRSVEGLGDQHLPGKQIEAPPRD
jgi:hypothetical protein